MVEPRTSCSKLDRCGGVGPTAGGGGEPSVILWSPLQYGGPLGPGGLKLRRGPESIAIPMG